MDTPLNRRTRLRETGTGDVLEVDGVTDGPAGSEGVYFLARRLQDSAAVVVSGEDIGAGKRYETFDFVG